MSSESKDRLFLTLISIAVFFPSLDIYFVGDNISHIENASKSLTDIGFHYYRPLTILTLIFDRAVWGIHHYGYHISNLLIHIVNVLLVYHFAKTLKNSRFFALSSSLLFLLHPIHSTSLFWISGRVDMICTLFYLVAIICFTNYVRSREKHQLIISSICFVFSLFSKEMAITLPLVLAAYIFVNSTSKLKQRFNESIKLTLPYWIILFAFALFRVFTAGMAVLSGTVHTNIQPLHLLKNLATFIGMLIVPGGHIAISNFLKANPELIIAFSISLLISVVIALKWISKWKILLFLFFFLIITLFPVIRLAMRWYLYLPSVGFCIAFGYLIYKLSKVQWYGKTISSLALATISLVYIFFITTEQERWLTSGRISKEVTSLVAKKIVDENLNGLSIISVPGEYEETPILIYGLESIVNLRLRTEYGFDKHVPVDAHTYASLRDAQDWDIVETKRIESKLIQLSLANTDSYFVFPNQAKWISGQETIYPGLSIRQKRSELLIDRINNLGQAIEVTINIEREIESVFHFQNRELEKY